jgi:hypothetical protein
MGPTTTAGSGARVDRRQLEGGVQQNSVRRRIPAVSGGHRRANATCAYDLLFNQPDQTASPDATENERTVAISLAEPLDPCPRIEGLIEPVMMYAQTGRDNAGLDVVPVGRLTSRGLPDGSGERTTAMCRRGVPVHEDLGGSQQAMEKKRPGNQVYVSNHSPEIGLCDLRRHARPFQHSTPHGHRIVDSSSCSRKMTGDPLQRVQTFISPHACTRVDWAVSPLSPCTSL